MLDFSSKAIPHFIKGVIQVHILFDNPGCIPHNTPKAVEQHRRGSAHALSPEHQHYKFFDSAVPSNWRDCLHCRSCKRRLVLYIGETFPKTAPDFLLGPQELVIGGCFEGAQQQDALVISQFSAYVHPNLKSNAEEADTRVWIHAFNSFGCKNIIEFPLRLPLLRPETFDVYVQLSPVNSIEIKLLHLNSLYTSLLNDHDLASVSPLL